MKRRNMQKGVVAVEFALVLPLFLLLLLGIVEFSLILYDQAVITNASREAARSAIAFKTPKLTAAQVQAIAVARSNFLISLGGANTPTVVITPAVIPATAGTAISVNVKYNYNFLVFHKIIPFFHHIVPDPLPLSATTVMNNE